MGADEKEPKTARSDVDSATTPDADAGPEPAKPEPAKPEPTAAAASEPVVSEPLVSEPVEARPVPVAAASRRPVVALAAVSAVLLVTAIVLGVLFAQERSAHDESRRDLRAESARASQAEDVLAAVRAQRADLEAKLTATEAKVLSPEAVAAIRSCVTMYAQLERIISETGIPPSIPGSERYVGIVRVDGNNQSTLCGAAEPLLPA